MSTFKAWVGFTEGIPHKGPIRDDYGTVGCVQIFGSQAEARKRFQDVRRVYVTINKTRPRKRK